MAASRETSADVAMVGAAAHYYCNSRYRIGAFDEPRQAATAQNDVCGAALRVSTVELSY